MSRRAEGPALARRRNKLALAIGIPIALFAAWIGFAEDPRPATVAAPSESAPAVAIPEVATSCRVSGVIENGVAARVLIHSRAAEIDLEAETDGHRFDAELPELGAISIVAVEKDGRTIEETAECYGAVRVVLAFPSSRGLARVHGRCTYLDTGAPVAGAIVRGASWTAVADDRGAFVQHVAPGRYAITCTKDMDESEARTVLLEPNRDREVSLTVSARASVIGVVNDALGEPVAGARVIGKSSAQTAREELLREETTDREGRFRLRGLSPGPVTVTADSEGRFAEEQLIAKPGLPYAETTLVLRATGLAIRVHVDDPDGVPIEGAKIRVRARGNSWRPPRVPIERAGLTDQAGDLVALGLVPGRYQIDASMTGFVTQATEVADLAAPGADVKIQLARACRARVRVLPEKPPSLVTVRIENASKGEDDEPYVPGTTLSGQTGEIFTIEDRSGSVEIFATSEGAVGRTATAAIDLCRAPDPIELDLAKQNGGGAVEVDVTDPRGRPLEGIEVGTGPVQIEAVTDARGKARIEGLEPGEYGVRAREGLAKLFEIKGNETVRVQLVVDRDDGEVSGTVVSGGRAVEGAAIRAQCGDGGQTRTLRDAPIVARTDARGSFAFPPKQGGVCLVRAEAPALGTSEPVTLRSGALPGLIEIQSFARIEGRVVELASRRPVSPYTLTIRPVSRASDVDVRAQYVANEDGTFVAEGVPPGALSIAVTSELGRAHLEVNVEAGRVLSNVELAVFAEGVVRGRVVGPEGGIEGVAVMLRRISHSTYWGETATERLANGRTGPGGAFELRVAAGDPMRLLVSSEELYPWGSAPFTLDPTGRATDLGEIRVEPRASDEEKEGGIGIMFGADPRGMRIIQFLEDSPARDTGLLLGDVITAIDGTPSGRMPMVNWVVALRGPPGTPVRLEIERGTSPRFTVEVIRRAVGLQALPTAP